MKYFSLIALCLLFFGCGKPVNTQTSPPQKTEIPDIPYPTETPSGYSVRCSRQSYKPVCGEIIVQCIKAPCPPIKQTFPNTCAAKEHDALVLHEGSCKEVVVKKPDEPDLYNAFFISRDVKECTRVLFECEEGQVPFGDSRGCGCVTAPKNTLNTIAESKPILPPENILIYGESSNECPSSDTKIDCPPTWNPYNKETGCGCFK